MVYVAAVSGLRWVYVAFTAFHCMFRSVFTLGLRSGLRGFTKCLRRACSVSRELAVCLYRTVSHVMPVRASQSFEFDCGRPYNTLDQYNAFEGIGMI